MYYDAYMCSWIFRLRTVRPVQFEDIINEFEILKVSRLYLLDIVDIFK
jgi:hypothetical protein